MCIYVCMYAALKCSPSGLSVGHSIHLFLHSAQALCSIIVCRQVSSAVGGTTLPFGCTKGRHQGETHTHTHRHIFIRVSR